MAALIPKQYKFIGDSQGGPSQHHLEHATASLLKRHRSSILQENLLSYKTKEGNLEDLIDFVEFHSVRL